MDLTENLCSKSRLFEIWSTKQAKNVLQIPEFSNLEHKEFLLDKTCDIHDREVADALELGHVFIEVCDQLIEVFR